MACNSRHHAWPLFKNSISAANDQRRVVPQCTKKGYVLAKQQSRNCARPTRVFGRDDDRDTALSTGLLIGALSSSSRDWAADSYVLTATQQHGIEEVSKLRSATLPATLQSYFCENVGEFKKFIFREFSPKWAAHHRLPH
jgi:hypothetical protein